ncbi:MAG: CCA tRNA nucleotidyltransferase [Anaerolineae bacterium]|nr:CCA tRNA nucleotidyltransferase [Anaerolineae bacterium]
MSKFSHLPASHVLEQVFSICQERNLAVYLVGGVPRDILRNRPTRDIDLLVQNDACGIARKVANRLQGHFYVLDNARNTARVILYPNGQKLEVDFASQRGDTLEADLRERDFTINAMAFDLQSPHQLIDPLGGARDLHEAILRPCSPDSITNDPVRILRAVRFSLEYGLRMHVSLKQAIQEGISLLPQVSGERQRDEIFRILDSEYAAAAIRLLDQLQVTDVLFPELTAQKNLQNTSPYPETVWEHTLSTMQSLFSILVILCGETVREKLNNPVYGFLKLRIGNYTQSLKTYFAAPLNIDRTRRSLLQFAALYHKADKSAQTSIAYHMDSIHAAQSATKRARELKLSAAEVKHIEKIVRQQNALSPIMENGQVPSRREIYRFFRNCQGAGIEVIILFLADMLANYGVTLSQEKWETAINICQVMLDAYWNEIGDIINPKILLNGDDLQRIFGLAPGPQIGVIIEAVREAQAAGEIQNRQQALSFVEHWIKSFENHAEGEEEDGISAS